MWRKVILAALFLVLYLLNTEVAIAPFFFFTGGVILYLLLMGLCCRDGISTGLMEMLCFTWPFSWDTVLGASIGGMNQVTWFYITIGLLLVYKLVSVKRRGKMQFSRNEFLLFLFCLAGILFSAARAPESGMALKEVFPLLCFLLSSLLLQGDEESLEYEQTEKIYQAMTVSCVITSVTIVIQYMAYHFLHIPLFEMEFSGSYGGKAQLCCTALLEDGSSATVFFACGAILAFSRIKERKAYIAVLICVLAGMGLSGRRTGLVAFLITLAIYMFTRGNGVGRKILYLFLFLIILYASYSFINLSRPLEQISQMIDNNGRFDMYMDSIRLFARNPLWGYGMDERWMSSLMSDGVIVHNTILRWANFGGALLAVPMIMYVLILIYRAYRKGNITFWLILCGAVGAQFIPDIINARFVTILACLIAVEQPAYMKTLEKAERQGRHSDENIIGYDSQFE